jgi:methyl coenzyme M reductase subunit C
VVGKVPTQVLGELPLGLPVQPKLGLHVAALGHVPLRVVTDARLIISEVRHELLVTAELDIGLVDQAEQGLQAPRTRRKRLVRRG